MVCVAFARRSGLASDTVDAPSSKHRCDEAGWPHDHKFDGTCVHDSIVCPDACYILAANELPRYLTLRTRA